MTAPVVSTFGRVFLIVFGVVCVVAGFHPDTTMRRRGDTPCAVTRAQRVVLVVFGCLFVLYGAMGWLN